MKLLRSNEELANATAVQPDSAADGPKNGELARSSYRASSADFLDPTVHSPPMMVMNTVNTVAMSAGPVE